MTNQLRFGSLFAGVGGFDLGLERCGMTPAWSVEKDAQARSVLRRHWPGIPHYEDVHDVGPELTPVDLICGGFPCQDYSVAGKRGGLVGDRGALWWEMHRIIADVRPTWVVGENVPGILSSSGGSDFATILSSLVGWDVPTPPDGWGSAGLIQGRSDHYGVVFAVLDSQYAGVAQRRRRLFIVGHSGGVPRPEVLALSEGLFGHPAPSRTQGEEVAGCLGGGAAGEGGWRNDLDTNRAFPLLEVGGRTNGDGYRDGDGIGKPGNPMYSLQARHQHGVVNTLPTKYRGDPHEGTDTLVVAHTFSDPRRHDERHRGELREKPCLNADNNDLVLAQAFDWQSGGDARGLELRDSSSALHVGQTPAVMAMNLRGRDGGANAELCDLASLRAASGGSSRSHVTTAIPRRLTPTECERLQGFPDGWTESGVDEDGNEKPMADGPRYRCMGNAVTVNVIEWIGRRIVSAT